MPKHLDPKALPKIKNRLKRCKAALNTCRRAKSYDAFQDAWTDLLTLGGTIFSTLEQAAKLTPQGRHWFGAKPRRDRKSDPLVKYMVQARNSDQHGIEPVTKHEKGGIGIKLGSSDGRSVTVKGGSVGPDGISISGAVYTDTGEPAPINVEMIPDRPILTSVKDTRYGTVFHPPVERKGKQFSPDDPISVAEAYIDYLDDLVSEAQALMTDTTDNS